MTLPVVGTWTVRLDGARPFSIHGDRYFELQITRVDEPGAGPMLVRVPEHVSGASLEVGERFAMTFLMGQITSLKRVGDGAADGAP